MMKGDAVVASVGGGEGDAADSKARAYYTRAPYPCVSQIVLLCGEYDLTFAGMLVVSYAICVPDKKKVRRTDPRGGHLDGVVARVLARLVDLRPNLSRAQVRAVLSLSFGQDLGAETAVAGGQPGGFKVLAGRTMRRPGGAGGQLVEFDDQDELKLARNADGALELAPATKRSPVVLVYPDDRSELGLRQDGVRVFLDVLGALRELGAERRSEGGGTEPGRLEIEFELLLKIVRVLHESHAAWENLNLVGFLDEYLAYFCGMVRDTVKAISAGQAPSEATMWPSDFATLVQRRENAQFRRLVSRYERRGATNSTGFSSYDAVFQWDVLKNTLATGGPNSGGGGGGGGGGGARKATAGCLGWGKPFAGNEAAFAAAGVERAHRGKAGHPGVGCGVANKLVVDNKACCSLLMHKRAAAMRTGTGQKVPRRTTTGPEPHKEKKGSAFCGWPKCKLSHVVVPKEVREKAHGGLFAALSPALQR
jgi:hypothetical protein